MFQLVDCFFFVSLGITFLLLFLMAFHFKTRISTLEKKNNALADMCTTIVAKISQVKQMVVAQNAHSLPPNPEEMHMHSMIPNIFFRSPNHNSSVEIIEIPESESDDSDSDDDEDKERESESDDESLEEEIELNELKVEEEPIHLEKTMDVLEVVVPDADLQSEVFSLAINHDDKNSFKKMNVQMLRTLVISKGLCTDPSKMKKLDLLKMLSDSESEIN
jgi:hypothetical protein